MNPMKENLHKWERRIAYGLLAVTPFVITPDTEDSFIVGKTVWIACLAVIWFLLIIWRNGFRWQKPSELDWPISAMLGAYLVSLIVSFQSPAQLRTYGLVLIFVGLLYAFRRLWSIDGSPRAVAWILAATAALLATYGILQDYGVDLFNFSGGVRDWRAKVIATLGNPNFLGGYLSYCIPVIVGLGLRRGAKWWEVILAGVALGLSFACLAVTFCVGATLGLLLLIFVMPITLFIVRPTFRVSLLRLVLYIIIAASAVGWYLLDNPNNSHGGSLYAEAKSSPQWTSGVGARRFNWLTTKIMMQENPILGIGFHNYLTVHIHYQGLNYQRYGRPHDRDYVIPVDQPHFQLMESAAEAGPLGGSAVAWLMAAWIASAVRRLKQEREAPWFAWGAYAGVWVVLAHSMSSFPFHLPASALVCVVLASYLVSRTPKPKEDVESPAWVKTTAAVIAVIVIAYSYTPIIAERALRLGRASQGLDSIAYLERARRWGPFHHQTYLMLGVRYIQQGWLENAEKALLQSLQYQENHQVHVYLAKLYQRTGELEKAVEQQRRVIELNPVYPGHYRELAELLKQTGDEAGAQTALQKAAELDEALKK
ncbi:MAG: O-antigen ligase family protein [Candidatus Hinthialibacter antarcticus]|nr:O-antigen ligase family protein [Candidatus Hinthialibacter antarcticus]